MRVKVSLLTVSVSVASLLLASMTGLAHAKNYKENYKGEALLPPCPLEVMLRDGVYVGAAAGVDSYRTHDRVAFTSPDGNAFIADPRLDLFGGAIGMFVGYGKYFNNFYNSYLGVEIFANGSSAEADWEFTVDTFTGDELATRAKAESNFGISLLPGIKINNNTLFYVRLGYNWSLLDVDEVFTIDGIQFVNTDKSSRSSGFSYGLGIESAFYDRWSARAEYTHTNYNSFNSAISTKINAENNQFMLGMIYHVDFI